MKAIEALQGSVETLKAEKAEMQKELNILKGKRRESITSDENNQMEMVKKVDYAVVETEKPDKQVGSANLSAEIMDFRGDMNTSTNKKCLMETKNDALVHSVQADMQIELEAQRAPERDLRTKENPTENSSADAITGNIQIDLEFSKAKQVDPFKYEGN